MVAVGLALGVGQFGLLFLAMHAGMPAGLSSLVLQVQAVFTAALAVLLLGERPGRTRLAGMALALTRIVVAALDPHLAAPLAAFGLVLGAAACWGLSNILTRKAAPSDALSWIVWVSAVSPLPMFGLSLVFEGWYADLAALRALDLAGLATIGYLAWVATLFGFGAWGLLLRHYDASPVAPYSLLVPVFGMGSAALLLGERVRPWGWAAAALLVSGVALTSLSSPRTTTRPTWPT